MKPLFRRKKPKPVVYRCKCGYHTFDHRPSLFTGRCPRCTYFAKESA